MLALFARAFISYFIFVQIHMYYKFEPIWIHIGDSLKVAWKIIKRHSNVSDRWVGIKRIFIRRPAFAGCYGKFMLEC